MSESPTPVRSSSPFETTVSNREHRSTTPSTIQHTIPSTSVTSPDNNRQTESSSSSQHNKKHQSDSDQSRKHSNHTETILTSSSPYIDEKNAQQFCLRWNNYQTNLTSVFDKLLQNESFVDVTLTCDGHSIKAHKIVLSACSPYFQALFLDNPCQHPIIIMSDVKWPLLKAIIDFMYKGEINVNQDQIGPLLRVAELLKIRGLADVTGDSEINATHVSERILPVLPAQLSATTTSAASTTASSYNKKQQPRLIPKDWNLMDGSRTNRDSTNNTNDFGNSSSSNSSELKSEPNHHRKRQWTPPMENNDRSINISTPDHLDAESPIPLNIIKNSTNVSASSSTISKRQRSTNSSSVSPPAFSNPLPLESMGLSSLLLSHSDDMEIKPEIAEMIREEERAKLMENVQSWPVATTSASIAESYQYQLQSMWQKCWSTNQNLVHQLRFRERGPLKSWLPETMAEAIFSVLKDGLSLSQAARKYDIPYPTFVLYANRVHNMLGPSIDGGPDIRPKGRGRPQRILLGIWPDEQIKEVIKTIVFRDAKEFKDEPMHLLYDRNSPIYPFQENQSGFPAGALSENGRGS